MNLMEGINNNTGNYTIAVIDDEEQIREVLYKKLTNMGYNVMSLEEAEDLIYHLKHDNKQLDLVILLIYTPCGCNQKFAV